MFYLLIDWHTSNCQISGTKITNDSTLCTVELFMLTVFGSLTKSSVRLTYTHALFCICCAAYKWYRFAMNTQMHDRNNVCCYFTLQLKRVQCFDVLERWIGWYDENRNLKQKFNRSLCYRTDQCCTLLCGFGIILILFRWAHLFLRHMNKWTFHVWIMIFLTPANWFWICFQFWCHICMKFLSAIAI